MSRAYTCWVEPENNEELKKETIDAMHLLCGDITLYGGQSDGEYAQEVITKLWKIEKRYVDFRIQMTYLEDLPYECYKYDKDEYEEMIGEH